MIHRNFAKNNTGDLIPFTNICQEPFIRWLEILTYDILFGKQYVTDFEAQLKQSHIHGWDKSGHDNFQKKQRSTEL